MTVPQINIGSTSRPFLHISQFIKLPSNTPWGNLCLKFCTIVQRLDYVNRKLFLIYGHFAEEKASQGVPYSISSLEIEEVVYWLRKSFDELIQLMFLGFCLKRDGCYPVKIEIQSIGELLKKKPVGFFELFAREASKLAQLNSASNAYKHSFINSQNNRVGRDEPLVLTLAARQNDRRRPVEANAIALSAFVIHFDGLYPFFKTKCVEFFA
jgi:hypothetical protein